MTCNPGRRELLSWGIVRPPVSAVIRDLRVECGPDVVPLRAREEQAGENEPSSDVAAIKRPPASRRGWVDRLARRRYTRGSISRMASLPRWGDGQEHPAVGASPPSMCWDTGLRSRKPWSICGPIESVSIPPLTNLLGWQPSRFLTDRAEAERAFVLAGRLPRRTTPAAAAEVRPPWPPAQKPSPRHGLGMPARNPEAVRPRAIAAATRRAG